MFSRQRSPGLWTFDSVVNDYEFEYWDSRFPDAIDGNGGGAYALASDLTIGGAAGVDIIFQTTFRSEADTILGTTTADILQVEATTTVHGPATFTALVGFDQDASFNANAFFFDNVTFNEDVTVAASALLDVYGGSHFRGVTQIGDTGADALNILAFSTFSEIATFGADTFFNNDVTLGAVATDTVSLKAIMRNSGSGRYVERQAFGGDADASYAPTAATHVIIRAGTLSTNRTYTVSDTGAVDGDRMRFTCLDTAFGVVVKSPTAAALATITFATGARKWCEVERIDGAWALVGTGTNP